MSQAELVALAAAAHAEPQFVSRYPSAEHSTIEQRLEGSVMVEALPSPHRLGWVEGREVFRDTHIYYKHDGSRVRDIIGALNEVPHNLTMALGGAMAELTAIEAAARQAGDVVPAYDFGGVA